MDSSEKRIKLSFRNKFFFSALVMSAHKNMFRGFSHTCNIQIVCVRKTTRIPSYRHLNNFCRTKSFISCVFLFAQATEKYFECNTACVTMYKRRKWMWQRPYQCDCIYLYIESGSMPLLFLLVLSILGISINLDLKSFICYLIQFITLLFSMELNGKEGVERKKNTHTHTVLFVHMTYLQYSVEIEAEKGARINNRK